MIKENIIIEEIPIEFNLYTDVEDVYIKGVKWDDIEDKPNIPTYEYIDGEISSLDNKKVNNDDSRLSDDRKPLPHTHILDDITNISTLDNKYQAKGNYLTPTDIEGKADKTEIPTKTSNLTNDSDFTTKSYVDDNINTVQGEINELEESKQDKLVSGTNIKTINNESILGEGNITIDGSTEIFWGEYGVTTYDEITQALNDGKFPIVKNGLDYLVYTGKHTNDGYTFGRFYSTEAYYANSCYIMPNNKWYTSNYRFAVNGSLTNGDVTKLTKETIGDENTPIYLNSGTPTVCNTLTKESDYLTLKNRVDELETFRTPNIVIYGNPNINNGQISGFNSNNYGQIPFITNFNKKPFKIYFSFQTGNNVTNQQNLFDSKFGLAFAIRNLHFVLAYGTDGTKWDNEIVGTHTILPNTTYYVSIDYMMNELSIRISTESFDNLTYDGGEMLSDFTPYPTQIIIGKDLTNSYIFGGIINLNYCSLLIDGVVKWEGMNIGTSKLNLDLSNINEEGKDAIKSISKPCNYYYAKGDGDTAGVWHCTVDEIDEYYDGLTILFYVNVAGATTTRLQVNELDAVQCFFNATTELSTQYAVGCIIPLTFINEDGTPKFKIADYNTNTTYSVMPNEYWFDSGLLDNSSVDLTTASVFGRLGNRNICCIHTSTGTGTSKKASTNGFDLDNYSLYYSILAATAGTTVKTYAGAYRCGAIDARYVVDKTTYTNRSKTYLVFTKGEDGLFYFNKPTATTVATFGDNWWWNDNAQGFPTDAASIAKAQGLYFYEVGLQASGTSYRTVGFSSDHHIFYYDENGNIKIYK